MPHDRPAGTVYVFERPVRIVPLDDRVRARSSSRSPASTSTTRSSAAAGRPATPGSRWATMRFIHETAGFVFIAAVLFRIYWGFVGNRYVRWRGMLPITKGQRRSLRDVVALLRLPRPPATDG